MCELLGFSVNGETRLEPWLTPFRLRGGGTGDNPDGWGVAWWSGREAGIVKSPDPGFSSPEFARLAADLRARLVIAHVRKARHPPVPGMLNTHPFAHVCCDREWVFAHNGLVPEVVEWRVAGPVCEPRGETDSEHAFCHLLTAIAGHYHESEHQSWLSRLAGLAGRIADLGKFNFLLSDGRVLIAYGHDRLHHLDISAGAARGVAIATEPLTGGDWLPFQPGELRVYRDGARLARITPGGDGPPAYFSARKPAKE